MLMINNLPQNNSAQNFGFKVKVKENSKLVDMAESRLFRSVSRLAIDEFEQKAADIFPEKTIHLEYSVWKPAPRELLEVNVFSDGKHVDNSLGHDAKGLLNYLRKATNKYNTIHSKFFYDGQKSPETLAKIAHFKETVYRPFSLSKNA